MTELTARNATPGEGRGSTLAIRAEQDRFSREQVEALRKMNGWDQVPDAELSVFFHQAQRTGLDPFARQIYLIGRRNNRANRTDYTIQTSIDGMRLVADRTGRYAGSDRPRYGEDGGDKYAEVTVYKIVHHTRVPFTGVAYEAEYSQERSPMWRKMPRAMLAKCAEALALRKAFPADLSGVYGQEEMEQAGEPLAGEPSVGATGPPDDVVEVEANIEHEDLLRLVGEAYNALPEDVQPDKRGVWEYAKRGEGEAQKALSRLHKLAEASEEAEPAPHPDEVEGVERGAAPGEDAPPEKVERLRSLAEEVAADGVAKMEQMLGKALGDLTEEEVDEWLNRLSGRQP